MFKRILSILALLALPALAVNSNLSTTKTLAAQDSALAVNTRGFNTVSFQSAGTWSGTLKFEGTVDGKHWFTVIGVKQSANANDSVVTANGAVVLSCNAYSSVRARMSSYSSGTDSITAMTIEGPGVVGLQSTSGGVSSNVAVTSIASGSNTIGNVGLVAGTAHVGAVKVDTMPALGAGTNHLGSVKVDTMPALGAGTNHLGTMKLDSVGAAAIALGQTTMSASLPVTLASNQSALSVSNGGTFAVQAAQSGNWNSRTFDSTGRGIGSDTAAPAANTRALDVRNIPSGTQAVSNAGTFATQAAQSGTWTVQPGNTANTTAWLVTGTGGTFPVTGTVTANAGTNLNTSALALDATIGRAQGSTTSGQTGPIVQGAVTTSAPSYTNAQTSPLSLTPAGNLRVDGSSVTQPVSGTITANAGSGTFTTQGAGAHGSSVTGNPFLQAFEGRTTDPTVVSSGQAVRGMATPDGKLVVMPYAIRPSTWSYAPPAAGLTSTTAVKVKAGAAGLRVCVTSLQVMNSHQTIGSEVVVYANPGASASTDTLWRGWAQFTGGGATATIPVQFCTPSTGDSLKIAEKTATGTAGILVNLQGYTTAE